MTYGNTTAVATTSDTAVTLAAKATFDSTGRANWRGLKISNTGGVAGFFSTDGGDTWGYLDASGVVLDDPDITGDIKIKRIPSGSNVTGVYCYLWEGRKG